MLHSDTPTSPLALSAYSFARDTNAQGLPRFPLRARARPVCLQGLRNAGSLTSRLPRVGCAPTPAPSTALAGACGRGGSLLRTRLYAASACSTTRAHSVTYTTMMPKVPCRRDVMKASQASHAPRTLGINIHATCNASCEVRRMGLCVWCMPAPHAQPCGKRQDYSAPLAYVPCTSS